MLVYLNRLSDLLFILARTANRGPRGAALEAGRVEVAEGPRGSPLEVLAVATRLGLTSFGGPIAHLGYFRDEYVVRRRWLDEESYADLVALCQFLPGPASSQLGIAIGTLRAGRLGGLAAWLGFTLPSAVALVVFAFVVEDVGDAGRGLAARARGRRGRGRRAGGVGMARRLAPDAPRLAIAGGGGGGRAGRVGRARPGRCRSLAAGVVGAVALPRRRRRAPRGSAAVVGRRLAVASLALFGVLLAGLPLLRGAVESQAARARSTRSTGPARSSSAAATSCCRSCTPRSSTRAG